MRTLAKCLANACALALTASGAAAGQPNPELARVYLGGGSLMPVVVNRVVPEYPGTVSPKPFSGDIDVETVVGTTGSVLHVRARHPGQGLDRFHAAALAAANKWEFRPAVLTNGTPLPVLVLLRMTFRGPRGELPAEASARLMPVPRVPPRSDLPVVSFLSVPPSSGLVLIRSIRPQYTSQARERQLQGSVTLNILILADGSIGEVSVAKSLDRQFGLDEQAVLAARYWLFEPTKVDGRPVAVRTTLELEFRLQG